MVDLPFRKPCWRSARGRASSRSGSRVLSRIFAGGKRSEMGRLLVLSSAGLLGFKRGMMRPFFKRGGIKHWLTQQVGSWTERICQMGQDVLA